ncbi:MAG: GNAT family N-acetyltransferase [Deltaproteobacteria bacterium]|nr:GNAT family N-acetyltransferase [Deltaproteobacteria bacterium]
MGRGATLTIRGAREQDAAALGSLLMAATERAPSSLYDADELGDDPRGLGEDVLDAARRDGSLVLVGEVGGELVGMVRAMPREFVRCAHVATVGVLVAPGWRRRGVGGAMLEEVAQRAFDRGGIERLEVHVAEDDGGLAALVGRHGFRAARVERGALVRDGARKDLSLFVRDR